MPEHHLLGSHIRRFLLEHGRRSESQSQHPAQLSGRDPCTAAVYDGAPSDRPRRPDGRACHRRRGPRIPPVPRTGAKEHGRDAESARERDPLALPVHRPPHPGIGGTREPAPSRALAASRSPDGALSGESRNRRRTGHTRSPTATGATRLRAAPVSVQHRRPGGRDGAPDARRA